MRRFVVFAGLLLIAVSLQAQKEYKLSVVVRPHHIRVNQPFAVIFSLKFPMASGRLNDDSMEGLLMPDTTDFILLGKPASMYLPDSASDGSWAKYKYSYTLAPKHPGDILLPMQLVQYNSRASFRYDSLLFHIYDDRITAEDSLVKKRAADSILITMKIASDSLMRNTKSQNGDWSSFFNPSFPKSAILASGIHKISAEVNPHYIRANQPFAVIFSTNVAHGYIRYEKLKELTMPDTTDFIILGEPIYNFVPITGRGNGTGVKYHCAYTLVPKHPGELMIPAKSTAYNDTVTFHYDTILIHIYDDRISAEDSTEKKRLADKVITPISFKTNQSVSTNQNNGGFNMTSQFKTSPFSPTLHDHGPDGIHFNYPDSVYNVHKGEVFEVIYSFSLVNMPDIMANDLSGIKTGNINCPKNVAVLSKSNRTSINFSSASGKNYTDSTLDHLVKFIIKKKGTYKIPPVEFTYKGQTYMSPEIKVIVSEP